MIFITKRRLQGRKSRIGDLFPAQQQLQIENGTVLSRS
jgi:hypothetical protein